MGIISEAVGKTLDLQRVGDLQSIASQLRVMPKAQVLRFVFKMRDTLPAARSSLSEFSYVANSMLSGFVGYNSSFSYRAAKLKEACYFSACYADQLALYNPFSKVKPNLEEAAVNDNFIMEFSFFLSMLLMMEPLIDKGIVTFIAPESDSLCTKCFFKALGEAGPDREKRHLTLELHNAIASGAQLRLLEIDGVLHQCIAQIEGPSHLFGNERHSITFEKHGRLLRNKDVGKLIPADKLENLGLLLPFAQTIVRDTVTKAAASRTLGIQRNFASSPEIAILKQAFGQSKVVTSKYESDAPILVSHSFEDLLRLRDQEWHHFESFRAALHASFIGNDNASAEENYRQVFLPELTKIGKIIDRNKSVKGREIIANSGIAILAVGSSIMTAGISSLVATIAGALGAGHFGKEMVPAIRDYMAVPQEAKDSQYYYAWRLREQTGKR